MCFSEAAKRERHRTVARAQGHGSEQPATGGQRPAQHEHDQPQHRSCDREAAQQQPEHRHARAVCKLGEHGERTEQCGRQQHERDGLKIARPRGDRRW